MNAKTVDKILGENKTSKFKATIELMRQLHELERTCKERPAQETAQMALKIVSEYRKTHGISYKNENSGLDVVINQMFFWLQNPKHNFVLRKSYWKSLLQKIVEQVFAGIKKGQLSLPYDPTDDPSWAIGGDIMKDPDYSTLVIKDIADAAYDGNIKPVRTIWLNVEKVFDDILTGRLQHLL